MNLRRVQSGFSAVEAVVSIAVLSVAMVGFLTAMTAATKVGDEELVEGDMQTDTRVLLDELTHDLDSASVCYIQPFSATSLGTPIITADTDNANNSFLLLKYQFALVGTDPNVPGTFGQPIYPLAFGATAPGSNTMTAGACYTLLFKMDRVTQFVQEWDPTAAPPTAVTGVKYIYKDLDGDGAYTSKFVVGRIERRFQASYSVTTPGTTSVADQFDKTYPGLVLIQWDTAANSPKNTIFKWLENPGNSAATGPASTGSNPCNWFDNCYHVFTNSATSPEMIPQGSQTLYPNNWIDSTGNGQWDPVLTISLSFLATGNSDDGRMANTRDRMKLATTSIFMRSQNK